MNLETYKSLTSKEKLIYDELSEFAKRLTLRMEEVIKILKEATCPPHDSSRAS